MLRSLAMMLFIPVLLTAAGCARGGSGIKVKGALVSNGQAIQPAPKAEDSVEIAFYPLDSKDTEKGGTAAVYNHADGSFEFHGQAGVGLVPGEYKVLVRYQPYEGDQGDVFKESFSAANSPLKYTITTDADQEIVIDVATKKVERKK